MADGNLRKIFMEHLTQAHWQAIETGGTGRGVPDANSCYKGVETWVEYKKTEHWAVEVRPEQVAWIERRVRYGGRAFIAVRRIPDNELWLLRSGAARILATRRQSLRNVPEELRCGVWPGGPARWDWPAIATILWK